MKMIVLEFNPAFTDESIEDINKELEDEGISDSDIINVESGDFGVYVWYRDED